MINYLASNATDVNEALRLLQKEEIEKGKNPSYKFIISADLNDPSLWCVLARPYKRERYVGGITGIIFGLNFRKIRYTHTIALPSSVYKRVFGGQDLNAVIIVEYTDEEKVSVLNQTENIFSFFVGTEGDGSIYIYPYEQKKIQHNTGAHRGAMLSYPKRHAQEIWSQ